MAACLFREYYELTENAGYLRSIPFVLFLLFFAETIPRKWSSVDAGNYLRNERRVFENCDRGGMVVKLPGTIEENKFKRGDAALQNIERCS